MKIGAQQFLSELIPHPFPGWGFCFPGSREFPDFNEVAFRKEQIFRLLV
jgi:hypothetical protein